MKKVVVLGVVALVIGCSLVGCGGSGSSGTSLSSQTAGKLAGPGTTPTYLSGSEGGGALPGGTARVKVFLTDAPNPAVDGAVVTISDVTVHKTGGSWFSVMSGSVTLDLLDLQNGVTALLGELDLEAGKYTQIRFSVDQGTVQSGSESYPVEVPSGEIKINRNIDVCSGGDLSIVIDFDAEKSLKYNKGQNLFKLQPVVKIDRIDSTCPDDGTGGGTTTPGEYTGALGWFSIVLPAVSKEDFSSLTAVIDDIQVHDQGIGQVTTFESSYTADLLEDARDVVDEESGEVTYTVLVPPVEIPAGDLDQIRLLFQSIVATDMDGKSVTIRLPSGGEGDGLKFFGSFTVCEDGLTVLVWNLALSSETLDFGGSGQLNVHPEIHGPELLSVCEPYPPAGE